ncbi:hypothetical protein F5B22DRAFT_592376 [Xylaria bambusicola]|uniref:uncharacterized protein n=1 Tax=Xylaria bambusicola TaxID=326684 RepID=UPI002008BB16|nr:uncharacterized protein F5B22DRAFT_592376 [Xylaria bambusicola]KAI0523874.1 hypothetical protein F5B22DRAFT_592376 [Xylaria bambusicola]
MDKVAMDHETLDRDMTRSEALTARVESKLEEKGHTDAVKTFRTALQDFMTEIVPLAETQTILETTIELTEDKSVRTEFAAFLDAPLDTPEQQATARAALCQISGIEFTMPWPKNHKVVVELLRKIPETAGKHWGPAGRENFRSFVRMFSSTAERSPAEETKRRKDLLEMAEPVSDLQEMLLKLWHAQDNPVW